MNKTLFCVVIVFLFLFQSNLVFAQRLNQAPNPSFENVTDGVAGWYPVGLAMDIPSSLILSNERAFKGEQSLKVLVSTDEIVDGTEFYSSYNAGEGVRFVRGQRGVYGVRTIAYRLDRDIKTFAASAWIYADNIKDIALEIRWYNRFGRRRPVERIHTSSLYKIQQSEGDWHQLTIEDARPNNAHQAQLAVVGSGKTPFFIDDVFIDMLREEGCQILVDQVGYECESKSKIALFQQTSQKQSLPTDYQIVCLDTQKVVQQGTWKSLGYLPEFDRSYWECDFSEIEKPGRYVVHSRIESNRYFSEPFQLSDSLIMDRVAQPAYEFFYYQRCGMEIPGFHGACHLDDSVLPDGSYKDLSGGWHDAGDYNKYNGYTPESFYALILVYDRKKEFFDRFDRDGDGIADLLDEALWGAKYLEKCLDLESMRLIGNVSTGYRYWGKPEDETDNRQRTGDERPVNDWNGNPSHLSAAFALLSKHVPDGEKYRSIAERLFERRGGTMTDLIALHDATQKAPYKKEAFNRASKMLQTSDEGLSHFRELSEFALNFPDSKLLPSIKRIGSKKLESLKIQCDAFFGIHQRGGRAGRNVYFMEYQKINDWYVGESREYLEAAYDGLLLDSLGWTDGRTVAENQLHWMFGRNPFNVSLMEGVGSRFIPQYHHRYNTLPACPNGGVLGAVVNGVTRSWPWVDRPWLDLNPVPTGEYQCNEPWLPHNNRMLFVLSMW